MSLADLLPRFTRVLLLHPEDDFDGPWSGEKWDVIVDLGRAPKSFYEQWSSGLGCQVFSIYDLAVEVEDLRIWRDLLGRGMGYVVDRFGIDWWDVIGLLLQREMQDIRLVERLAQKVRGCSGLAVTRPSLLADSLGLLLGIRLRVLQSGIRFRLANRVVRSQIALANLSFEQLRQVLYDKYDPQYHLRRRWSRRPSRSSEPTVLLPSAYSNVTRTALSYARLLPTQQFHLVLARESAAVPAVPSNVRVAALAAFAQRPTEAGQEQQLEKCWTRLEEHLREHPDFSLAVELGVLRRGRSRLRWGLTVRDAWNEVFEAHNVVSCLSADDTNPYTRIPLLLARKRGIAAVSCHHGALDCFMAFKVPCYSTYLAQGQMEWDYLVNACGVDPGTIRVGASAAPEENHSLWRDDAPWIVFFSEPYETDLWRTEAVYREVLPRLCASARKSGKAIVLKLHPFESARQRSRLVKATLAENDRRLVSIMDSPLSPKILRNTWCAVTVESTVAFECASFGIPALLCGWMRHAYSGYAPQYVRFGVGRMMDDPDELLCIPQMLREATPEPGARKRLVQVLTPDELAEVFLQPANREARSLGSRLP